MRLCFILIVLMISFGCSTGFPNDFKTSKKQAESLRTQRFSLDKKYVGFKKEDFIKAFGKPRTVIKNKYPYSLEPNCYAADCATGFADELLTYEFKDRTVTGITYYSVYAFIKDGVVVRIR